MSNSYTIIFLSFLILISFVVGSERVARINKTNLKAKISKDDSVCSDIHMDYDDITSLAAVQTTENEFLIDYYYFGEEVNSGHLEYSVQWSLCQNTDADGVIYHYFISALYPSKRIRHTYIQNGYDLLLSDYDADYDNEFKFRLMEDGDKINIAVYGDEGYSINIVDWEDYEEGLYFSQIVISSDTRSQWSITSL